MRVWLSKHALRDGYVIQVAAEASGKGVSVFANGRLRDYFEREFHATKGEANARAAEMRDNKIRNLEALIRRLKAMEFS